MKREVYTHHGTTLGTPYPPWYHPRVHHTTRDTGKEAYIPPGIQGRRHIYHPGYTAGEVHPMVHSRRGTPYGTPYCTPLRREVCFPMYPPLGERYASLCTHLGMYTGIPPWVYTPVYHPGYTRYLPGSVPMPAVRAVCNGECPGL